MDDGIGIGKGSKFAFTPLGPFTFAVVNKEAGFRKVIELVLLDHPENW